MEDKDCKVLPFKKDEQQETEPHAEGKAVCMKCKHEWHAVRPVESDSEVFECPKCHLNFGTFKNFFAPPEDVPIWECQCGGVFFIVTQKFVMCVNCGREQGF